jgi:hypothetical protein
VKATAKAYRKNFPEKFRIFASLRRAKKLQATPKWYGGFDEFVLEEAYDLSSKRQETTGVAWEVDHMVPLQAKTACGLHCADNIQVIPAKLNVAKHNHMIMTEPLEWLSRL